MSEGLPAVNSFGPGGSQALLCQSVMITKRPKLLTEMSCRSGTWVHLRCTRNAASAPFLEGCSLSRSQQGLPRMGVSVIGTESPANKSSPGCNGVGLP